MTRLTKHEAAANYESEHICVQDLIVNIPFTAAGFCVSVVSVVAASYFTACDDEFNNSNMHLIYRGCKPTKMRINR